MKHTVHKQKEAVKTLMTICQSQSQKSNIIYEIPKIHYFLGSILSTEHQSSATIKCSSPLTMEKHYSHLGYRDASVL